MRRCQPARIVILLALLSGGATMASKQSAPLAGAWGGDRLNLELTALGGTLALDCASGVIDGPLRPDAAGHFNARGTWSAHQSGPQRADEPQTAAPALFEGHVWGDSMHLNVTVAGTLQRFTLSQGSRVKLVRCL